jgi:hypothetical protein
MPGIAERSSKTNSIISRYFEIVSALNSGSGSTCSRPARSAIYLFLRKPCPAYRAEQEIPLFAANAPVRR